jgi:hypothetical protein
VAALSGQWKFAAISRHHYQPITNLNQAALTSNLPISELYIRRLTR